MHNLFFIFALLQLLVHNVTGTNATVYYPSSVDESTARIYLEVINRMYLDDTTRFRISLKEELKVRLCHDVYEFSNLTGADSVFSPLWKDGTLYALIQGDLSDSSYRSVLEAGVVRSLLSQLHQNGAPWWLINSAAAYESGEYKSCTSPGIINVAHFSDLDEKIQTASTSTELADLCFYLGMTGRFFDLRFGSGSMMQLVHEFQHETNVSEAVKAVFHVDLTKVENDWQDFLMKASEEK